MRTIYPVAAGSVASAALLAVYLGVLTALALLALVCPAVVIWVLRKQRAVEAQLGMRKAPTDAKQSGETARRTQA